MLLRSFRGYRRIHQAEFWLDVDLLLSNKFSSTTCISEGMCSWLISLRVCILIGLVDFFDLVIYRLIDVMTLRRLSSSRYHHGWILWLHQHHCSVRIHNMCSQVCCVIYYIDVLRAILWSDCVILQGIDKVLALKQKGCIGLTRWGERGEVWGATWSGIGVCCIQGCLI